jgi:23S rRNA-/tRNA-specific pseudouridylate synthase
MIMNSGLKAATWTKRTAENLDHIFEAPVRPPAASDGYGRLVGAAGFLSPEAGQAGELVARLTRRNPDEARALVAFGCLWVDDRPFSDPVRSLAGHSHFRFNPPAYGPVRFYEADPGRIVHEDDDLLIYHKEAGRPSQGVPYDAHNNVLAALGRLLTGRGGPAGLWLPHRLDAETSGLLLLAKNQAAAGAVGRAFQAGQVTRTYLALGLGARPERDFFQVEAAIAKEGARYVTRPEGPGRAARTDFTVLDQRDFAPGAPEMKEILFRAEPLTGRTHQIRLHLALAGWPVRGDRFYGRAEVEAASPAPRLMLAAVSLGLSHPARSGRLEVSLI